MKNKAGVMEGETQKGKEIRKKMKTGEESSLGDR